MPNINSFINEFLSPLGDKEREVIIGRYGLDGKEPLTLQAIGDRYGITRERVRQIEAGALNLLGKKLNHPYFKSFIQKAVVRLTSVGGVEEENSFLSNLQKSVSDRGEAVDFVNRARFLLELSGKAAVYRDILNKDWHPHWYLKEDHRKRAHNFVGRLVSALENEKTAVLASTKRFNEVLNSTARAHKISENAGRNYLGLSRRFGVGPFGTFGLLNWPEINPVTASDWSYVILKREKKPLHFSDLSRIISQHRKNRRTNLQTIHNEVIKDDRFVLVGRGLYALREQGFTPGTAREVITQILKKHGPLSSREVIPLVKEQRFIKDATILINLQNRKYFTCLSGGRYSPREA